ncbi:MAG: LamG domain-containing protein [Polyangiaceae bacterium]
MTKANQSFLLLAVILGAVGACKPNLDKLTSGGDSGGGNGGEAGGGAGGKTQNTGGRAGSTGSSTGGTAGSSGGVGGGSSGGSSNTGGTTGSTSTVCILEPFVPGDAPSLKYDFDVAGADGTPIGDPTWSTTGRIGGSVVLDSNKYIQLPADVLKDFSAVTVATWIKLSANVTGSTLFDFGTSATNHFYLRANAGSTNNISFGAQVNGGTVQETVTSYVFPTGVWKHVALSVGDGKINLYIDGLNVATRTITFAPSALGATSGNFIGHTHSTTASTYGSIDDFRIYPRVLPTAEVESLAAPGSDYIHFRFDEPCGNKAYDRSSAALVGDLSSEGTWTSSGHVGGGLTFNGTDQYLKLPANIIQNCNDLTVAMWVQHEQALPWDRLITFEKDLGNLMTITPMASSGMQFIAKVNSAETRGSADEQVLSASGTNSPQRGLWGHVAVVLKGGTGTLYFNGQVAASGSISIKPSDLGATALNVVGAPLYSAFEPYFRGTIDNLRISCRGYTAQEIGLLALGDRDK